MNKILNDFQMVIASTNGSGTLTSNRVLHKALFRHGYNVVGKNLFPSNIEGLPTYYFLRVSKSSQCLKSSNEIYVALNPTTYARDLTTLVNPKTVVLLNSDLKLTAPESANFEISFKQTVKSSSAPIKIKKRMSNMSYVGWLGCYLNLDVQIIKDVIATQFSNPEIIDENINVMLEGWNSCTSNVKVDDSIKNKSDTEILIEGNQASALGWVDGGCTVATWYPITPSTSLVESFETYAKSLRPNLSNVTNVAVVQSEDEISAIASVVGAGWAGSRAATATSGPGLSLMSEALGLAYFAEIPAVVCDVQRVGPSTGLPTRTSQGDLEFAYKISHGDTFHPVLLPSNPLECYTQSALAFDVADKYQTPVFVLTDLDLGMNLWTSETLALKPSDHTQDFERSQILTETDLENLEAQNKTFKRYSGDENGIPFRTLPGTHHPKAAYFTRGSGHNESAGYSEHPEDYEKLMLRLQKKIMSTRNDLPAPLINFSSDEFSDLHATVLDNKSNLQAQKIGLIYYGTTAQIFPELSQLLSFEINTCQVMALPLHDQVYDFINDHDMVFVIEQNRDGQLKNIIQQSDQLTHSQNLHAILHFDGWSIQADVVAQKIMRAMNPELSHPELEGAL
jgi:2-oxoglutarate ferredoxin oxidoreductase subunit alpha